MKRFFYVALSAVLLAIVPVCIASDFALATAELVDGNDYRKKFSQTEFTKSVLPLKCKESSGEFQHGTGFIVVPPSRSDRRDFETIVSARHVLYEYDGTPRVCSFRLKLNDVLQSVYFKAPNKISPFVEDPSDYEEVADDAVVAIVNRRLTDCSSNDCPVSVSTGITLRSEIKPFLVKKLDQPSAIEDLIERGSYKSETKAGVPYTVTLKHLRVFSNTPDNIIMSSSGEYLNDGSPAFDFDPNNKIYGLARGGEVLIGGWSTTPIASGGLGLATLEAKFMDGEVYGVIDHALFVHFGSTAYKTKIAGEKYLRGAARDIYAPNGQSRANLGVRLDILEDEIQEIHNSRK